MEVRYFEKRGIWHLDFVDALGKRQRPSTGCRTKEEAKEKEAAVLARLSSPNRSTKQTAATMAQPCGMTLQQAFDRGMKGGREKWTRAKSPESIRSNFQALVTSAPDLLTANMDCSVLTRALVQNLMERWKQEQGIRDGQPLSASAINKRLFITNNLLELVDLPPHGVKALSVTNSRRMRRVTEKERQAVIGWLTAHHHRSGALTLADMIQVGRECGARMSELLGLRWSDVYLDQGVMVFRETKNNESREGDVMPITQRIFERRRTYGMTGPFADLTTAQAHQLWKEAREAMGLGDDHEFVFHVATRHECLTALAETSASAYLVQAVGGHKSIVSSSKYVKPSRASRRAALESSLTAVRND